MIAGERVQKAEICWCTMTAVGVNWFDRDFGEQLSRSSAGDNSDRL